MQYMESRPVVLMGAWAALLIIMWAQLVAGAPDIGAYEQRPK